MFNPMNWHYLPIEQKVREDEKNKLTELTQLFFSYVFSNSTRIAELRKEKLEKHMRKRAIQTGSLFFSSSLKHYIIILMMMMAFSMPIQAQNVVINEINYRSVASQQDIEFVEIYNAESTAVNLSGWSLTKGCLLYTSPSPRDLSTSRMPSSA